MTIRLRSFLISLLLLTSYGLHAQPGQWTWIKGDSTANSKGHFGTQGVPDPANMPPALYEANGWTDKDGNFWLFGGSGIGAYADLWKYDPLANLWTWVKGPGITDQESVYGTQGVPSVINSPGSLAYGFVTWVDLKGDFWLFGGYRNIGTFNNLWRYRIATNEWTWMKGSAIVSDAGQHGAYRVPSPANNPPARCEGRVGWTDQYGDLWMFGGQDPPFYNWNDLWNYNINSNQWTWMHGSNVGNQPGIYGTKTVADPQNTPSSRMVYSHWKDSGGKFWIFGGKIGSFYKNLNDLWCFDPQSLSWTWMSGSDTINQTGVCSGLCLPDVDNIPTARFENSAYWKGNCERFYMYGGVSDFGSPAGYWSDLWCYNKPFNEWTLVKGSLTPNTAAYRGIPGQSGPLNHPPALNGSCSWTDSNGNLWLFGGAASGGLSNELWRFVPDPDCPPASPLEDIAISRDTSICKGSKLMITASGGAQYHWSPESGVSNPDIANPWVSPDKRTTYTVYISDFCRKTDSLSVTIDVQECLATIPNVFTPNGDGINDNFEVIYKGPLPYHLIIFNRWGAKIFESDQIDQQWDGRHKGAEASAGTYFYVITIGAEQFQGIVTLIR